LTKEALINEIENREIDEHQIKLLLKKRKAFLYEDEVRILVAPHGRLKEAKIFKIDVDIRLLQLNTCSIHAWKKQCKFLKSFSCGNTEFRLGIPDYTLIFPGIKSS